MDKHYKTYTKIGLNILYYRKAQGLTQEDLAELTSFSRNQIQRVETAYSTPSLAILLDISEALGISVKELFEFKD